MPRVSLRRGLLYLATATTCSFLLLSVHNPNNGWLTVSGPRNGQGPSRNPPNHPVLLQLLNHESGDRDDNRFKDGLLASEAASANEVDQEDLSLKLPLVEPQVPLEPDIPLPPIVNNFTKPPPEKLPWYLKNGLLRPSVPPDSETYERKQKLWPDEDEGDRIVEQLMYKPPLPPPEEDHPDVGGENSPLSYKKILMYNGVSSWNVKAGRGAFLKQKCPVDTCVLTGSRSEASTADAIVFKDHFNPPHHQRTANQVWIMYMLECPLHTQQFSVKNVFNWTATYRHDSDIVTPYERFVYYDQNVRQKLQDINYAANKTKHVAWFVSNCGARNNRLNYAKELAKYIPVDIYGACGSHRCPRSNSAKCFEMLNKEYKFYLAFENSNCRDYITEKFFVNGLRYREILKYHVSSSLSKHVISPLDRRCLSFLTLYTLVIS
ncbi:Glycoprotein 3-alpha-L-fucosyltransferase A [Armadillidium vulgare]|nr:Glycoprotein 3-alpha-L-fucosyltransferase A [Armadillidium vulgare]